METRVKKIYILGTSGTGKSFLGKILSETTGIKHNDLDDAYFIRKYDKPRSKEGREREAKKIWKKKEWIIEGNGGLWNRDVMKYSDLVI